MMANNTSILIGRYSLFGKDAVVDVDADAGGLVMTKHLSYYVAVGCILLAAYFFRSKKQLIDVPLYKVASTKWFYDAENLVKDSYTKFYDQVYQIRATEGPQVLLPPKFVGELKGLPEETLSAVKAVEEAMLAEYTLFSLGHNSDLLLNILRTKLTQNLARLVPEMKEEIDHIIATEFPECEDWTPVKVHPFCVRAIARIGGRAFVGPMLNRNEQWMDININYAIHAFMSVIKLQFIPAFLRPIGQYLVTDLWRLRRDLRQATELLRPIMEERLQDMATPGSQMPDDLIQWVMDSTAEEERRNFGQMAHLQLLLSAASIHSTNNLLANCVYDLAARPDCQEELRQEVTDVLNCDEAWARKDSIVRLKKLDSFIRESQRLSGNIVGFIRKVMTPIVLSDGTHLPAGTKVIAPQAGVSSDDRYFDAAENFDPLRFFRLRQRSEEDANRWQLTTLGDTNVNFGAGKHACPGRFFASNEIKMVLAYYLLNYDMKLKDGEGRPKALVMMMTKMPDMKGEILFKKRRGSAVA